MYYRATGLRLLGQPIAQNAEERLHVGEGRRGIVVVADEPGAVLLRRDEVDDAARLAKSGIAVVAFAGHVHGRLEQRAVDAERLRVRRAVLCLLAIPLVS